MGTDKQKESEFPDWLKAKLKELGWTQKRLSDESGVLQSNVTNAQITTMLARRIPRTPAAQIQRDYDAQISKFRTDIQALLK